MAISKSIGYPELFITFTCNPKWSKGVKSEDRPDILSRIFKMKLDQLIKDLKMGNIFGKSTGGSYN